MSDSEQLNEFLELAEIDELLFFLYMKKVQNVGSCWQFNMLPKLLVYTLVLQVVSFSTATNGNLPVN